MEASTVMICVPVGAMFVYIGCTQWDLEFYMRITARLKTFHHGLGLFKRGISFPVSAAIFISGPWDVQVQSVKREKPLTQYF